MSITFSLDIGQGVVARSENWYKVIQHLGTGGNAVTYLVLCSQGHLKGGFFAMKVFYRLSEKSRREKFLDEIAFLKDCDHPSIMRVYDEGVYNTGLSEYPFVIAEYLPTTFAQLDYSTLGLVDKLCFTLQLLSGLSFMQALVPRVVHRDIKPANIFIKGRTCVLGDFGLMKRVDTVDEIDREVFKQSLGPGMPYRYRTPDLVDYANNRAPLSEKTDVFQLGLVVAELFTGINLCKSVEDCLTPVELSKLPFIEGHLGGSIASLIRKMLTFNSADRPHAHDLLTFWERNFMEAVQASHVLYGQVFEPISKINIRK